VSDARLELAEAAAFAEMWDALGLPSRVAGATCLSFPPDPANTMLNRVVGLGLAGPVADADLDAIDAFFCAAGTTQYSISVARDAEPELQDKLGGRRFAEGYAWMRFRRGTGPAPPVETELRIEPTRDGDTFGRIVAAGFELPPEAAGSFAPLVGRPGWSMFLALDGDEPAAAAALFVRDGVGWFGAAATLPEHRRKGAQNALLAARIERARELGLEELTVETGERVPDRPSNSYRNILRAGFEELYLRPNFVSPE
jgi:GNAT superfamily N-acetyltransferase